MSVWYCIPSARPPAEAESVLKRWREQGYKIAIQRDEHEAPPPGWKRDDGGYPAWENCVVYFRPYLGYAEAVNHLIAQMSAYDTDAAWLVTGGDDVLPDPTKRAEEIARECSEHFEMVYLRSTGTLNPGPGDYRIASELATFGVMQPTGDRFGISPENPDPQMRSAYIDRVCGSPWMGREFCKRINQGKGPLWPEYFHMGCDEELQAVATKLGVLWQSPDLTHHHQHWGRPRDGERMAPSDRMPEFLKRANSGEEWQKYKRLFEERKAAGFPGSEPI